MSSFVLKIIAILSMVIDHSGYLIFDKFSFMNYMGRLAFPIFAFLITEGYIHTSNFKKYVYRLLIFGIISQIPYMLFFNNNTFTLNILFTLALGLITISIYNKFKNKLFGFLSVIWFAVLAHFLHFEYGWFGISIIFIFYFFKKEKTYMNILFFITTFINYIYYFSKTLRIEYLLIILFCTLALVPINLYNGKKGKNIKYFLYLFYPLHLIALYILDFIFNLKVLFI